jgi:hypothetical protein
MLIKSWTMRLGGHVACMEGEEMHTGFWWVNLNKRQHLEDLGIDRRIILKQPYRNRQGQHEVG